MLWKRTLAAETPPGARAVLGDLRATCTGTDGTRASGPGSTFAIGTATITCTATDAFGVPATQSLTVTVRDTTPPVLTVPTGIALVASGGSATHTFAVGQITSRDLVDGDCMATTTPSPACRPICTTDGGSTLTLGTDTFPTGVTTVTCTVDRHAQQHRARLVHGRGVRHGRCWRRRR